MQCAFSSISCGMPLSGAAITSENTAADSSNRLADSLSTARSGATARAATIINFMFFASSVGGNLRQPEYCTHRPNCAGIETAVNSNVLNVGGKHGRGGLTSRGHVTGYGQACWVARAVTSA